jgi:hypothetical protein
MQFGRKVPAHHIPSGNFYLAILAGVTDQSIFADHPYPAAFAPSEALV